MALMLAPYNEAMRLGMGFNSYTQQLCVNDVVQKPGGIKGSERDLRSDGQSSVSQVVSWEAGFVDNMSEVINSLNISGALEITVAALGGGAGGHGNYIDNSTFKQADAKYNITVKVTNQKLIANEITQFVPIPNVPESKFSEVYGDSFISGFIEGGVFNAVVTKTKIDKTKTKEYGGGLSIEMDLKVAKVKGSAEGSKTDTTNEQEYSTEIKLNWSGGGDIKPDDVKEWDIPALTRVAMEFPDNVAACPQRTYAILTKYSSLRSFHEQMVKGSPLDYENAGIYTSSLLDAYMDYKSMWKEIAEIIYEQEKGQSKYHPRKSDDNLITYGKNFQEDYDLRTKAFEEESKTALARPGAYAGIVLEKPLPPNELQPYIPDIFGLDKARRDCRFEMIKIVREVGEVSNNPKVATDPYRNWRYLSPNIFKRLLPTPKTAEEIEADRIKTKEEMEAERLKNEEEIKKVKDDLQAQIQGYAKENDTLKKQLTEREEEQKRIQEDAEKQKEVHATNETEAQSQREAYENQVQQAKAEAAELKKLKEDVEKQLQEKAEAEKKLQEHDSQTQAQLQEVSERKVAAEQAIESLQRGIQEKDGKIREYGELAQRESARAESVTQELNRLREAAQQGPAITLHSIIWANQQLIGNGGVEQKVRQFIENRWGFTFDNDFFGCDPTPGREKAGSIVYCRRGESVKSVVGSEHQGSAFY
ncbi:uncharacterized protein BDZ99DRAFT_423807 [Mytilinidion resinicola]|uniref:Uncharacterized protein n=1 Tax=Mytilinidion resinicola TaxID=574789 RepID=A0A6A6YAJ6_9PEZI|nr:uncharacterized protein BDZ99DRAFT_423807 [Mytilinidion resinicola]KAF2805523.1 hypothetical protein BDZ99DRAFT_423807 [Mytilinidion resinicola]